MSPEPTVRPRSHSETIAANSLYMILDNFFALGGSIIASIAVARTFGPELLGYYSYIMWLVAITSTVGRFGLPVAMRKYLAELLATGQVPLARSVARKLFLAQSALAAAAVVAGAVVVFFSLPERFHAFAWIGVFAIAPSMILGTVTGANTAIEKYGPNVKASLASNVVHLAGLGLTILLGWGLIGLSSSLLASRLVDLAMRYAAYRQEFAPRFDGVPAVALPRDLKQRIGNFCFHATVLQILHMVVWDRSEMIFLKWFSPIQQVAFYSICFSMVQQTTLLYRPFVGAAGSNLNWRHNVDRSAAERMLDTMVRYIALIAIPATLGMAVLSAPLITALYGSKYLPAIPVLFIVALFGSARALMAPLEQYLQAADRQDLLVRAMALTSIVNVVLAVLLIPAGGAIGAALSNGLSQTLGALACWLLTLRVFPLKISWPRVGRILVASLGMAAAVWPLTTALPSWASLAVGAPLGAAVYLLLLRWTGSLDREDSNRLSAIGSKLPSRFVPLYQRLLMSLIPVGAR